MLLEQLESRQFMSVSVFTEKPLPHTSHTAALNVRRARASSATVLENNVAITGLSGTAHSQRLFRIDVPAGASNLVFKMTGRGDADIYVRHGAAPTTDDYDFRPYRSGSGETVSVAAPRAGAWYVMVRGYTAYSRVTLTARYDSPAEDSKAGDDADGDRETWAVLLGASDYPGSQDDLPDCAADAKNMSQLLSEQLDVDKNHQHVFTGKNITESLISQQMTWLRQNADADDTIVFYYSGHGGYGRYKYTDDDETLWLPADQDFHESELRTQLQAFPTGTERVVMLDSCYSGGFTGLTKTVSNTMVVAASEFDEVSYGYSRGDTPNHMYGGIFTSWFIYGYNADRADSNDDGTVTMREAFAYARPHVIDHSDQTPMIAGNVII